MTDTSKSGSSSESKSIRQHQEASVVLISHVGSFNSPVGAQLNLCGVRVPDTEALPRRPEAHPAREENGACLEANGVWVMLSACRPGSMFHRTIFPLLGRANLYDFAWIMSFGSTDFSS